MEKKQSSIDWLEWQINLGLSERGLISAFKEAKAMHKAEIVDAYTECWMNDGGNGFHKVKEAESYYTETFGGETE